MKIHLIAATALVLSASALAQTSDVKDDMSAPVEATTTISLDPMVAIAPPASWTAEQRALYDAHLASYPNAWTAAERASFREQLLLPPAQWTAEQRALWELHYAALPTSWTPEQRTMYEQQVAEFRTPWMMAHQTASTATATTLAQASPRVVHPSNADPEHDARGIAVISAAAVVPDGYNGFAGTGVGGPLVDPATGETIQAADASYPPCTAAATDNCIQLYERGVGAQSAGMGGPIKGEDEVGDNTVEDDAVDVDTRADGTLDVDGDLDGDGDNDIE